MTPRGPHLFLLIAALTTLAGCHHGPKPAGPVPDPDKPLFTGVLVPAKPHKPFIGPLEIGVFTSEVAEALHVEKLSIPILAEDDKLYDRYREAVRDIYGADLADMNYFSIGHLNWQRGIPRLHHWLLRAGVYGGPTLALEPDAEGDAYAALKDSPLTRQLRDVFLDVKKKNITVWIRFASEANLFGSRYSVAKSDEILEHYKVAARWWKSFMPDNAKLVFSPLVDTAYEASIKGGSRQLAILRAMYEPGLYARIGGTLYSTNYNVFDMYDWYTKFMREMDPATPLQICELGGPLTHQKEIVDFINAAAKGRWKGLEKINLFAGRLNARAEHEYGRFGFVIPGKSVSYIRQIFFPDSPSSSS
ncbi:MAG TPA: hypothetical protein VKT78_16950 [Fimbriimonadaceae bacterium]|nr:hypothetical protein [Fimbriimonadaceae bacterium]